MTNATEDAAHSEIVAHHDKLLIVDFGSQVTQLIARRVREAGVYCEIHPFQNADHAFRELSPKAVILSGGPCSVTDEGSPRAPDAALHFNRLDRAVEGTGSAFHAPCLVDQHCRLFAFSKDPVGADLAAPPAVDTPLRVIHKGILAIRVEHQTTPRNQRAPKRTARTIPHPAMATITLI